MEGNIKILLVEDVKTDAELIETELEYSGMAFSIQRVETKDAYVSALHNLAPDIILSDYTLPIFSALDALKIRNELAPYTPLILVTGAQTEEIAVDCIKKGADDYILKSSLTRLPTSITNSLQKKKAERDNRLSFEKYRNLFENSMVGMFRASTKDCVFLEANEKAKHILGIENIIGKPFEVLNSLQDTEELCQQLVNGNDHIENHEIQICKPDGSKAWISISAKFYESENIIEGIIQDITSTKNSFLELESANYELDRFVYHASHDMRAPLRSLIGLQQVIMEEDSIEEIQACAVMMQRSTEKLDNLIEDLLVLARNKKSEARITSIDFKHELEDCISQLKFMQNIHKIDLQSHIQQDSSFRSDAVRLRIILNNIISNAIKYHRLDQSQPLIQIQITVDSDKANLSITDNGAGIDEKHLSKIFDMFYRATSTTEGTGLGLYLVKQTVDKLQGKISVSSKLNQGTTFSIEIPNVQSNTADLKATNSQEVPQVQ